MMKKMLPVGILSCHPRDRRVRRQDRPRNPPDVLVAKTIKDLQGTVKEGALVTDVECAPGEQEWLPPVDLVRFRVLRREEPKGCPECPGEFKVRAELDLRTPRGYLFEENTITWEDKDLKEGVIYIYRVVSVNHWGYQSAPSNDFVIKWGPPPPPPEFAAPADTQQKQGQ